MRTLIITATILVPVAASAGGYLVPSMSPRDLALSQTAVANEEGAEAVALNTAALAGQEGLDIGVALGFLSNRTEWSDPSLGSASQSQANTPPGLAVSYGQKLANNRAWGIGVGFGAPAGGSIDWPDGWAGRYAIQSVKQQVFAIGVGGAFQLMPTVKFGVSYVRFQATEEIHQALNFMDHDAHATLGLAGGGNSFGLAGEFTHPRLPLSLGITYSHSADIDLTGHIHFDDVPPGFVEQLHDQGLSRTVLIPDVLTVGVAYEAVPNVTVMAGYEFEHWSDYKADTFIGTDTITGPDGMPTHFETSVRRDYNNAHVFRVAGEAKKLPFLPQLTGRAGALYSLSDQPATTLSPSLTDASSIALSLGAGYAISSDLHIDVGYQHAFFFDVTSQGADAFAGTYKTAVDLLSLGVNWRTDVGGRAPAR